ncbi:hypothetical protein ASE07_06420 [Noviherbaspirillum sp. Root189]|nr:hypothetical protein ASE07_06420 [Noviherbaspirillum sp. Root189]
MGGDQGNFSDKSESPGNISLGNSAGVYSKDAFQRILDRQPPARVRAALETKQIPSKNEAQAREWLAEKDAQRRQADDEREVELREREISAAERATEAAERSARWAAFAATISVAALLISAWPYLPFNK